MLCLQLEFVKNVVGTFIVIFMFIRLVAVVAVVVVVCIIPVESYFDSFILLLNRVVVHDNI